MAEEQRLQESHRLCANNCGFFGSPATMDLCSKCYRDRRLKEEQQRRQKNCLPFPVSSSSTPLAAAEATGPSAATASPAALFSLADAVEDAESAAEEKKAKAAAVPGPPNRCGSCRKRVGLTGFQCRCGATFCGAHRLAEQHGCSFDFKAAGRDAIARANPLVKADKLRKI